LYETSQSVKTFKQKDHNFKIIILYYDIHMHVDLDIIRE